MPVATFGAQTAPSGKHEMECVLVEEIAGRFGDAALRIVFEVMDGQFLGYQARKVIGTNFAADTTAGQFVGQMVGHSLGRNDRVELNDFLGQRFLVHVAGAQIVKIAPVAKS